MILTIILVLVLTISTICFFEKPTIKYDEEVWLSGKYKEMFLSDLFMEVIPEPSEIDGYETSMFYSCYYSDVYLKYTFEKYCMIDSFALELTFSEENYKKAEADLFERYVFLEESMTNAGGWGKMPFAETKLGGYTLKFIYDHPYKYFYPMDTPFVAFNGKNKIRYCYQFNNGLDSVSSKDLIGYIKNGFKLDW